MKLQLKNKSLSFNVSQFRLFLRDDISSRLIKYALHSDSKFFNVLTQYYMQCIDDLQILSENRDVNIYIAVMCISQYETRNENLVR